MKHQPLLIKRSKIKLKKKEKISKLQYVFVLQAKTPLRSISNVLVFKFKRTCVSSKTYLRLKANALAFLRLLH